jgi:hypothetical protein
MSLGGHWAQQHYGAWLYEHNAIILCTDDIDILLFINLFPSISASQFIHITLLLNKYCIFFSLVSGKVPKVVVEADYSMSGLIQPEA